MNGIRTAIFLNVVSFFLLSSFAQGQEGESFFLSADGLSQWLPDRWKYHPGDSAEWADPLYDDSAWEIAQTGLSPDRLPQNGWPGTGWFRLHIEIDSTLLNKPLGLRIRQAGSAEIFLDGKLLFSQGQQIGDSGRWLKAFSFEKASTHLFAVRYTNENIQKFHTAGFDAGFYLRIGNIDTMVAAESRRLEIFTSYQMFFTALSLAVGLLHMILFFFFPQIRPNLYFALFLFSYAAAIYFDYQSALAMDVEQTLFAMRMHRAVMPLLIIFGLRFAYSLFYEQLPKRFWWISAALVGLGLFAVYKPGEYFTYFGIAMFAVFLEIARVFSLKVFKRKEGKLLIGVAFFLLIIFVTFDALLDLGLDVPFREMQNPYSFGVVGFFLAMSIYLSRDIARTNKRLAEQEIEQRLIEAENARKTQELEAARALQMSMLPHCTNDIPGLDICFHTQPALEVGGDYYDYHLAEDGTLTIAIGDATGHGMQAGMMVSVVKSLFISQAPSSDLTAFFEKSSQTIRQMKLGNLYMALMLVKLNDRKLIASSAGMPPIYIYRSATKSVEEMLIKGMPLGGPGNYPYQLRETDLAPGDTVLLMSDGFPELFNGEQEMLDYARVQEIFAQVAEKSATEIVRQFMSYAQNWRESRPQDDDVTFVVLKSQRF